MCVSWIVALSSATAVLHPLFCADSHHVLLVNVVRFRSGIARSKSSLIQAINEHLRAHAR